MQARQLSNQLTPFVLRQPELEEVEENVEPIQARFAGGGHQQSQNNDLEKDDGLEARQPRSRVGNAAPRLRTRQDKIQPLIGAGQPLRTSDRAFFESRFGYNFDQVRVYTQARAAETARVLNATAYTVGSNIVFAHGQYQPNTRIGRKTLAHELAHVIQQRIVKRSDGTRKSSIEPKLHIAHRTIQRQARFQPGRIGTWNPAESLPKYNLFGYTKPEVNGNIIWEPGQTEQQLLVQAQNAVNWPIIGYRRRRSGIYECWIDEVPENVVSYEIIVPKAGSWTSPVDRSVLFDVFRSVEMASWVSEYDFLCKEHGHKQVTMKIEGRPDNAALITGIRNHENRHAEQFRAALRAVISPWDESLSYVRNQDLRGFGPSPDHECDRSLFAWTGNDPTQIMVRWVNHWLHAAREFHATPIGGKIRPSLIHDTLTFDSPQCKIVTLPFRLPTDPQVFTMHYI